MNVSWQNSESYVLVNPSYSKFEQERFNGILKAPYGWPGHFWLSTSGSSTQKWVGLSKQAVLASAHAVNQHLGTCKEDNWVTALPNFHVGGLGIWARAYLSGSKVYDFKKEYPGKWQAEEFYRYLQQVKGTLSALVPTQLHDLVTLKKTAPACLRAIIIGGGALVPDLYEKAVALGWPVLPSYGLTECASQVATATINSWQKSAKPALQLLGHLQAREQEGRLCFAGSSLMSTYAYLDHQEVRFVDPKKEGWLISEDRGLIQNKELTILGRADAVIKIGGENVDLAHLEMHLQTLRLQLGIRAEATLLVMPNHRLGHSIHLASNSLDQEGIASLIKQFQKDVLPFERIRKIYFVAQLPRSPLGKILKNDLMDLVKNLEGVDA